MPGRAFAEIPCAHLSPFTAVQPWLHSFAQRALSPWASVPSVSVYLCGDMDPHSCSVCAGGTIAAGWASGVLGEGRKRACPVCVPIQVWRALSPLAGVYCCPSSVRALGGELRGAGALLGIPVPCGQCVSCAAVAAAMCWVSQCTVGSGPLCPCPLRVEVCAEVSAGDHGAVLYHV